MKANIVQVGRIVNRNPINWSFDSYTNIPALSISGKGILYYGYTIEELGIYSDSKILVTGLFTGRCKFPRGFSLNKEV